MRKIEKPKTRSDRRRVEKVIREMKGEMMEGWVVLDE